MHTPLDVLPKKAATWHTVSQYSEKKKEKEDLPVELRCSCVALAAGITHSSYQVLPCAPIYLIVEYDSSRSLLSPEVFGQLPKSCL